MATVNFYLKSETPDKNGEVHIQLQVVDGWRSRISFFKVKKKHWSSKKQRVNPGRKTEPDNNYVFINDALTKIKTRAQKYFLIRLSDGLPTSKEDFEIYIKSKELDKNMSFSDVWKLYLKESKHRLSSGTINSYNAVLNLLFKFSETKNVPLRFDSINNHFLQLLSDYFIENEYSENYLSKVRRNIRTVYNFAIDQQIVEAKNLKFLIKAEKTKKVVALTISELILLKGCDKLSETQNIVRDIFLFLCYSGLRVSEVRFLKSQVDYAAGILTIRPKKESAKIEKKLLIPQAIEILQKYDDPKRIEALPMISDQKFNSIIKDCCEIAKIKTQTDSEVFLTNGIKTVIYPKYKLITSHVGRKTFNTVISKKLNLTEHQQASGHTTVDVLKHYIGSNDDDIREKIKDAFSNV